MTPAPTTCADLPTAKASCGALDDRANAFEATEPFGLVQPPDRPLCEPPAYDCVPPEEPAAKGCHGCGFALAAWCTRRDATPDHWIRDHLSGDRMTPKPNAPECPGRVER